MDDITWKCTSIKLNVQSMPLPRVSNDKLDGFTSNPRFCKIYNNYKIKQSWRQNVKTRRQILLQCADIFFKKSQLPESVTESFCSIVFKKPSFFYDID